MHEVFSFILLLMQLHLFLTIHITTFLWSLINLPTQWYCGSELYQFAAFFWEKKNIYILHHFKFTAFLWMSPCNLHMKQQSVYLFLHSVCQCGLWYHRAFVETPQLNLRVVIHRRQNCPDLWMKSILNCPGQLMHCQFYKEKNIFLCRGITGVGFTFTYKCNIFKWQSQMYFPALKMLYVSCFLKSDLKFILGLELTNYYSNMQRKCILVLQCLFSGRSQVSFQLDAYMRYTEKLGPRSEK